MVTDPIRHSYVQDQSRIVDEAGLLTAAKTLATVILGFTEKLETTEDRVKKLEFQV